MILEARNCLLESVCPMKIGGPLGLRDALLYIIVFISTLSALEGNAAEIDTEQRIGRRGIRTRSLAVLHGLKLLGPGANLEAWGIAWQAEGLP